MKSRMIFLMSIGAISLTLFLYWIDSDPAYPEFGQTLIEFLLTSAFMFAIFSSIYLIVKSVMKLTRAQ